MMNKLRFFLFFFFLSAFLFGQTSIKGDSLISIFKNEKKDSNKINLLNDITGELTFINPRESLKYAELQLQLAKEMGWEKGISDAYCNIGNANYGLGNFSVALKYWLKDLEKRKYLHDTISILKALTNIGGVCQDLGDFKRALEYDIRALKLAEEIRDKKYIVMSFCNVACVHKDLGDQKKALEYYFKSLKLAEEIGYKSMLGIDLGNIGGVYQNKGDYKIALEYYFKALNIDEQQGNNRNVASWLANIAETFQFQSDSAKIAGNNSQMEYLSSKSLSFNLKALKLLEELDDIGLQCIVLRNIGNVYVEKHNYANAEIYLQKALTLATKTNSINEIKDNHLLFNSLYKKMNKPAKALEHYEKYVTIKDSLFNENNRKTISELQIKYETEKKESENKTLAQQNKIQALSITNSRYLMIGLVGLFILVASYGFLIFRQNKLKSKQLAIQFEQKLLRTQMNPHFIFNSLACIESYIYEHQPKEAGVYLSSFSRLMRLILESSSEEYITLDKEIEILNYYLSLQKLRLDDKLSYTIEVDKKINTEHVFLPPMLMQPFIENAIEHGFRGSKQLGEIKVLFSLVENNLQVEISDNGIGIEKAQHQKDLHKDHKSMAMQITQERLKYLNKTRKKKFSFTITDIGDKETGRTGTRIIFAIPI